MTRPECLNRSVAILPTRELRDAGFNKLEET
jgi:hypothetical protein